MEVKGGGDYRAHAVLLPYPSQGHVNPMLQLAKRLASKGVKVTLATTHYTVRSISAPGVGVEPISDGFDEAGFRQAPSAEAYLEEFKRSGSRTLAELMSRFELMGTPVDCIVYDSFLTWALDVARKLGALGVAFFTTSAIYASIFCRMRHGLLGPFPVTTKGQPLELPGFLPLRFEDLPTFITKPSAVFAGYWDMLLNQFSNLDEADWVLGNSLEAVDGEVAKAISHLWPAKMIGPMVPSAYLDGRIKGDTRYGASLWKPIRDESLQWLDSKPTSSVVFVAFGSMAGLAPAQMGEVASSLKKYGRPFVWVVKESELCNLPEGFQQSVEDQGLVVTWCEQLEVLSHKAVGCFVTHCGWNSSLEGLSIGVPMVAMPQWADQPTNAKLLEEGLGVGLRAKANEGGIVSGEEMERCIREVMEEGEMGKKIKENGKKWKELAKQAVDEGGSSDMVIQELVAALESRRNGRAVIDGCTPCARPHDQ